MYAIGFSHGFFLLPATTIAQACTTSGAYTLGGCIEIVTCAAKAPPVMPPNGMSITGGYVLQASSRNCHYLSAS